MEYSETGVTQALTGRESIAFDFISEDIDRAKEAYDTKCRSNAENGKKGGRPQKANGFEEKPKKANGFFENPKKPNKEKEEEKEESEEESKKKLNPLTPFEGCEALKSAFSDWLRYKTERREGYKPTGLQALVSEVRHKADMYGEEAVAAVIRISMASGWVGICFDKLKEAGAPQRKTVQQGGGGNVFLSLLEDEA